MRFIGILAADACGAIGYKGKLPWHVPQDLQHFQDTTRNQIIVMGRKTYDTLPKSLLKSRQAYVVTRAVSLATLQSDGATFIPSIETLRELRSAEESIYMIGGAQLMLYCVAHDYLAYMLFTQVHGTYLGDTYLPLGIFAAWRKTLLKACDGCDIYRLDRPVTEELTEAYWNI